ncbi:MAG: class I SAM-dependent methyltransferase [Ferruginibacter sp.]
MLNTIQSLLGQTDIYLIDQIMKGRYKPGDSILDAGCGSGRNMCWFLQNGFHINGIDSNRVAIEELQEKFPELSSRFTVAAVEETSFADEQFNHVICSAVLHFAKHTAHFKLMLKELTRILKPGGTLFIRMTADIGIENRVQQLADGVYLIPDGSTRFLLTRTLLAECMQEFDLSFSEPVKTTNVADERCMSTLVLQKMS